MIPSAEQKEIIDATEDNVVIFAGPGTGKSHTILVKIEDLIIQKSIDPETILVATFTNSAAEDLKSKLKDFLKSKGISKIPKVTTLHGFALRQLMKNKTKIKYLPDAFNVANDFEQRWVIEQDIKRILKLPRIEKAQDLFHRLSANWETLNADRDGWETEFGDPGFIGAWQKHREIFGYILRSELVYQLNKALNSIRDLIIDGPYEYLIVDEYQDLNKCDLSVIKKISEKGSKIFAAGDDDQSIYGFRYAFPEGIRQFTKDYKNSKEYKITECRRCDFNVLELATNVIRQDYTSTPKNTKSVTGSPGEVYLLEFDNQYKESKKIAEIILNLQQKGIEDKDIIILLRSDRYRVFSKIIEQDLRDLQLKVDTSNDYLKYLQEDPAIYFLSILKLLTNKENDLAFRTFLQLTKNIGEKTIEELYNLCIARNCRFFGLINDIANNTISDFKSKDKVTKALNELQEFKKIQETETLSQLLEKLFLHTNVAKDFQQWLKISMGTFGFLKTEDIINFVDTLLLKAELDQNNVNGIRIMTMHKAKGLTAKVVFVLAVEDEIIPGRHNNDEERRLLYVALTRAKNLLFMTYCNTRIDGQLHTGYTPSITPRRNLSRFLADLTYIKPLNGDKFIYKK